MKPAPFRALRIAVAFIIVFAAPLARGLAAEAQLSPEQILKALDTIEAEHKKSQLTNLNGVLSELDAAQASNQALVALYGKAVFGTQFDGSKGDSSEFRKWQEKNEGLLRNPAFLRALGLHVKYLGLSIEYAEGTDLAALSEPLSDYLHQLWQPPPPKEDAEKTPGEATDLLNKSVADGIIAKYYQIDLLLSNLQNWELTPSKDMPIFDKQFLPPLRKAKSPNVITAWDDLIAARTEESKRSTLADKLARFQEDILPRLLWKRARDIAAIGRLNEGATEMLSIIRTYPLHADNPGWIADLRSLLQPGDGKAAGN